MKTSIWILKLIITQLVIIVDVHWNILDLWSQLLNWWTTVNIMSSINTSNEFNRQQNFGKHWGIFDFFFSFIFYIVLPNDRVHGRNSHKIVQLLKLLMLLIAEFSFDGHQSISREILVAKSLKWKDSALMITVYIVFKDDETYSLLVYLCCCTHHSAMDIMDDLEWFQYWWTIDAPGGLCRLNVKPKEKMAEVN